MNLFLRTFADCENQQVAQTIAARIESALSQFSPQAVAEPRRYWKLPHLFEFTFVLTPATAASFREVVSASSGGWVHSQAGGELSSVWNRGRDHAFLVPEVSWAEVQLYEEAA
jgi:hypothetical protein